MLFPFQRTVQDAAGDVVSGAEVKVYDAGTFDFVSLYEDINGSTPIDQSTNTVTSDVDGHVLFYYAGGIYDIYIEKGSFSRVLVNHRVGIAWDELGGQPTDNNDLASILNDKLEEGDISRSNWDAAYTHTSNTSNPHGVTLEQARAQGNVLAGDVDLGGSVVTGLGVPGNGSDATNKDYVDGKIQGLDWRRSVLSVASAPPGTPTTGDRYLIGASATGDWMGHEDEITEWDGSAWIFFVPDDGWAVWVEDEDRQRNYNGVEWVFFGSTVAHNNTTGLQGGATDEFYHLTQTEHTRAAAFLDGGAKTHTEVETALVPAGGLTDQVLAKVSATDYDLAWVDQSGGGSVDESADYNWTGTNTWTENLTASTAGFLAKNSFGTWFDAFVNDDSDAEIFRGRDSVGNIVGHIETKNFDGIGGGYLDLVGSWRRSGSEIPSVGSDNEWTGKNDFLDTVSLKRFVGLNFLDEGQDHVFPDSDATGATYTRVSFRVGRSTDATNHASYTLYACDGANSPVTDWDLKTRIVQHRGQFKLISDTYNEHISLERSGINRQITITTGNGGRGRLVGGDWEATGDFYAGGEITAPSFNATSDRRKKKNVHFFNPDPAILHELSLRSFIHKDDEKERPRIGGIAQVVQKSLPEVVYKGNDGYLSMDYNAYSLSLISVLRDRLFAAEEKIEQLEAKHGL